MSQGSVVSRLYIGNLNYKLTTDELRDEFETVGKLKDASIVCDKLSGESKGFGFVEYYEEGDAKQALQKDGQELKGRPMRVNAARERSKR